MGIGGQRDRLHPFNAQVLRWRNLPGSVQPILAENLDPGIGSPRAAWPTSSYHGLFAQTKGMHTWLGGMTYLTAGGSEANPPAASFGKNGSAIIACTFSKWPGRVPQKM
jgi:hypothetical protein